MTHVQMDCIWKFHLKYVCSGIWGRGSRKGLNLNFEILIDLNAVVRNNREISSLPSHIPHPQWQHLEKVWNNITTRMLTLTVNRMVGQFHNKYPSCCPVIATLPSSLTCDDLCLLYSYNVIIWGILYKRSHLTANILALAFFHST